MSTVDHYDITTVSEIQNHTPYDVTFVNTEHASHNGVIGAGETLALSGDAAHVPYMGKDGTSYRNAMRFECKLGRRQVWQFRCDDGNHLRGSWAFFDDWECGKPGAYILGGTSAIEGSRAVTLVLQPDFTVVAQLSAP